MNYENTLVKLNKYTIFIWFGVKINKGLVVI